MKKYFLVLLLLVSNSFLFSWTDGGHKLVAYIAVEYLTDTARTNIYTIIGNSQRNKSYLSMADKVNVWIIDNAPKADYIPNKTGSWHYIDLPREKNFTRKDIAMFLATDTNNVVSQLSNEMAFFRKIHNYGPEAYTNLLLMIHFSGDIVQPMHNIEFNGDAGGNTRKFTNLFEFYNCYNKQVSLHLLWDLEANTNDIRDIDQTGAELVARINSTPAWEKAAWTNSSLIDWSYESYSNGINIYNDLSITNGSNSILAMDNLAAYRAKNEKTAFSQIEKGGLRLAYILNTLFGEDKPKKR